MKNVRIDNNSFLVLFFSGCLVLTASAQALAQSELPPVTTIADSGFFFEDDVVKSGFTMLTFEGFGIARPSVNINAEFQDKGARFSCTTDDGYACISGYKFKRSLSRGRCVANVYTEAKTGKTRRYRGTMRVDFCDPDNPNLGATIDKVGLFTEIVVPEQTILEAYNISGHRIGIMMSEGSKSSFMGFDSRQPIASIEIKQNDYLDCDHLNPDFAIDDFVFAIPSPDSSVWFGDEAVVIDDSGQPSTAKVLAERFSNDSITWYHGPHQPRQVTETPAQLFAMLDDGTVVRCNRSKTGFKLAAHSSIEIPDNQIVGYWGVEQRCLYPNGAISESLLVHPLYNLPVTEVAFDSDTATMSVEFAGEAIGAQAAPTLTTYLPEDSKAIEQAFQHLGFNDLGQIPISRAFTIWHRNPVTKRPEAGFLRTYDGQEFVLDGSLGIAIEKISPDHVALTIGEKSVQVPISDIQTLYRPAK